MTSRLTRSESRESLYSNSSCVSGVGEWQLGDRVKLGDKIGILAFVGQTNFAPGEWIGVILDMPEGKNNGSVNGQQYFTCAENHGIFCKSSKLVRIANSPALGSPLRELEKSPYSAQFGFDVGDRVIVSGGKIGCLRFLNTTDFAAGVWSGVELDQPLGKNDGMVQGRRYFICKPMHGIFAPATKTEKAPTINTPSKIRVHHNKTSMLRQRTGSHESLNSIGASSVSSRMTSATGTVPLKRPAARTVGGTTTDALVKALQETILEKDRHLEQMIQERDIERNEMGELTMRCEELERRIASGDGASDVKDDEKNRRLEKLENERKKIKNSLAEKGTLLEDVQFRLEEETIRAQEAEKQAHELMKALDDAKREQLGVQFDVANLEEKNSELDDRRQEIERLKSKGVEILNQLEKEQSDRKNMEKELQQLKEEVGNGTQCSQAIEEEKKKLVEKCDELEKELNRERDKMSRAALSHSDKENELLDAMKRINELQIYKKTAEEKERLFIIERKDGEEREEALKKEMTKLTSAEGDSSSIMKEMAIKREELDLELKSMKEIRDGLNNENAVMAEFLNQLQHNLNEMSVVVDDQKKEIAVLENSVECNKNETLKSSTLLIETQDKLQHTENELVCLRLSSEEQGKRFEEMGNAMSSMKEELEIVNKKKDELQKRNDEMESEICSLTSNVNESSRLINTLQEELVKEKETSTARWTSLVSSEEEWKNDVHEKEERIKSLLKELKEASENLDKENMQNEKLETNILQQATELQHSAALLTTTSANLNEKISALQSLKKENEKRDEERKITEEKIEKMKNDNEEKIREMEIKQTKERADLEKRAEELKEAVETLRTSLSSTTRLLSEKENVVVQSNESLAALKSSIAAAQLGDDEKNRQLTTAKEEIGMYRAKIEEKKRMVEKITEQLNEEVLNVEKERKDKEELEKRIKEECDKMDCRLKEQENQSHEEISKLEKELSRMVQELSSEREDVTRLKDEGEKTWKKSLMEEKKNVQGVMEERRKEMEDVVVKLSDIQSHLKTEKELREKLAEELRQSMLEKDSILKSLDELGKSHDSKVKEIEERFKKEKNEKDIEIEKLTVFLKNEEYTKNEGEETVLKTNESLSIMRSQMTELQEEVEKATKRGNEWEEEKKRLYKERETLEKDRQELQEEKKCLIAKMEESSQLMVQMEEMKEELKKEKGDTCRLESQIVNLQEALDTGRNEAEKEKVNMTNKVNELEKAKGILEESMMKIEKEMKETSEQSSIRIHAKEEELGKEREERKRLQGEVRLNVDDLQKNNEQTFINTQKMEKLRVEAETLKRELVRTKNERNEMNERLALVQSTHSSQQTMKAEMTEEVEKLREELENERGKRQEGEMNTKIQMILYSELESEWRKKEEKLAERIDDLSGQLEVARKKTATEEVESLRKQVEFLHSIIADKQTKEERLKEDIEILKNMPLDGSPMPRASRERPPRLFCDICDVFDLHDTDDCPTQAMQELDVSPMKTKTRPPPREYCDECQEFDHDTSACPKKVTETPRKPKRDYTF